MKRRILFVLFFIVGLTFSIFSDTLTEVSHFGANPGNLSMFFHPPKEPGVKRLPLVVVLHGCSQGAPAVAALTGWNHLADRYGFYVLYPQQHFTNNPSHCFNWFKKNEIERGKGECESIREMVIYMIKNFGLDTSQVFITGLSAGAAMGVVMIAAYPELFKAAAIFAGGPYKPGSNMLSSMSNMAFVANKTPADLGEPVWEQNPAFKGKYPRVLIFQGENDPVVNVRNANAIMVQWSYLHKMDTIPDQIIPNYLNKTDVSRYSYLNQEQEEFIVLYKFRNMGHAIPIDPGYCDNQGGKPGIFAVNKHFYSTYYTACEFGLVPEWKINGPTYISPGAKHVNFQVNVPGSEYNYSWKLPEAVTVVGEQNKSEIQVDWGLQPGSVTVISFAPNTCRYYHESLNVRLKQH